MIVAKFGGSSVKDAHSMRACSAIIETFQEISFVVISATYNTTNHLEEMARLALSNFPLALERLETNYLKHQKLSKELNVWEHCLSPMELIYQDAQNFLREIHSKRVKSASIDPLMMDSLYAIGERVSSLIFFCHLRERFPEKEIYLADAREFIKTDAQFNGAIPDPQKIKLRLKEKWQNIMNRPHTLIVTQGFIASNEQGNTTILGREGSDYTATLIAEAIAADLVQIWTDVPGVSIADPKIFPKSAIIENLSYDQAALMAQLGSKVLFSNTLSPSIRTGIPVFVGQTNNPSAGGTWIKAASNQDDKNEWPMTLSIMERQNLIFEKFKLSSNEFVIFSMVGGDDAQRVLASKTLEHIKGISIIEQGANSLSLQIPAKEKSNCIVLLGPFFN